MRIFQLMLCQILLWVCELTHYLSEKHEDKLQQWFIDIIGYSCPFALWSFHINEKYGFNIWKKGYQNDS